MPCLGEAPLDRVPDLAARAHGDLLLGSDVRWTAGAGLVDTVAGFAAAVARHAARLVAGGVRPGDVVAVLRRNHADLQAQLYGALRAGAVPALLPTRLNRREILHCLALLGRPYLVLDVAGVNRLHQAEDAARALCSGVFTLGPVDDATAAWAPPLPAAVPGTLPARVPEPRGVVLHDGRSRRPRLLPTPDLRARARALACPRTPAGAPTREPRPAGTGFVHLDFGTAHACATLLAALEQGVPLLAVVRTEQPLVDALLREHRPVSLEAPAAALTAWLPLAAAPTRPFSSVRRFVAGSGRLDPAAVRCLLDGSSAPDAVFVQRADHAPWEDRRPATKRRPG
ncbi:AMP-binding protein [Streptomyces sp. JJ36]|uniref:AMP-binding protein n=1 Tax=Streptomyces sp. JJ36 TaxID=2736645 RepID=UPI001F328E56|nr:AMP-binding protein [Streptomyces sp. JJ36]MCF6522526.1 AMP-binding protein [Streptomyces sp. JJ36]